MALEELPQEDIINFFAIRSMTQEINTDISMAGKELEDNYNLRAGRGFLEYAHETITLAKKAGFDRDYLEYLNQFTNTNPESFESLEKRYLKLAKKHEELCIEEAYEDVMIKNYVGGQE